MREIELTATGRQRTLPQGIFGFNAPVPYAIPHEDPRMVEVAREIAPGHLRFPGGSVANFFEWRSGQLEVPQVEGESMYRTFMRNAAARSRQVHPTGCHAESFTRLARSVGAELLWVANLESSPPEEQAAWAADMRARGVLPRRIELGNEFYLALLDDAASLARFPDWETTAGLMREYVDAMRPSLDDANVIAVQGAASRWRSDRDIGATGPHRRSWGWDDAMEPADWFDAVTVHPYPEIDHVCGPGTAATLPGSMATTLPMLLAKVDAGTQRVLDDTAGRMPGKEVWVTEWGAGEIASVVRGGRPVFNGMWLQVVARHALAMLRHPAVTVMSYHAFFFDGGVWAVARPVEGPAGFEPMGSATFAKWFSAAANGGAGYEAIDAGGAVRVPGGGPVATESFLDVEAALFHRDTGATVLVQNSSAEPARVRLGHLDRGEPSTVECMAPDLTASFAETTPLVETLRASETVDLPPWSLVRVVWS
jgi:hypothetical protein